MTWTPGTTTGAEMATQFNNLETLAGATDADLDALLAGFNAAVDARAAAMLPPVLGLWDFWTEEFIGNNNTSALNFFLGTAVSGGTNNAAVPSASILGYNNYGVFLRSSTTANGGFRYQATSVVADTFGTISHKFRGKFLWRTDFAGRIVRLGYMDTITFGDPVDGAYFEILDDQCAAKTSSNSTRTTSGTAATLSLNTPYTFELDVNAGGTEARYRIFSGTNETPIFDETLTTNIPASSTRVFGAGIVATEASTTASDIGVLYSLGVGTIAGFQRATGRT